MKKLLRFQAKALVLTAIFLIGIAGALSAQKIAIIDAGSSGSRLYVYELDKENKKLSVLCDGCESGAALSEIAKDHSKIDGFLKVMTKRKYGERVQLYVLATAGMREVNEADANALYREISRRVNGNDNYELKGAMTISGRYEGFCAWIAANYENGRLGFSTSTPEKPLTYTGTPYGILEIGGASMQITFAMDTPCSDCISRNGFSNIYSVSYLGGGVNALYAKYDGNTTPYNFYADLNKNLSDVKKLFPSGLKIWGLGGSIGAYFESGKTLENYSKSNERAKDARNRHPHMNAEYIKYVTESLGLSGKLEKPGKRSSWTEGAALDILLHGAKAGERPEPFNNN